MHSLNWYYVIGLSSVPDSMVVNILMKKKLTLKEKIAPSYIYITPLAFTA